MSAQDHNDREIRAIQQTNDLLLYNVEQADDEWIQCSNPVDIQDKQ